MALQKHIINTLRIMPIVLVAMVMMCGGVIVFSQSIYNSNSDRLALHQGGHSTVDLIYAFLESEECLQEFEEEESQFQNDYNHFKAGHSCFNGQIFSPYPTKDTLQAGTFQQCVLPVKSLYMAYCQLKIDC